MRATTLISGLLLALAAPAAAQTINGRVVDATTAQPVANARVTVETTAGRVTERARTDAEGRFSATLREPGSYHLRVAHDEYREVRTDATPVAFRESVELELKIARETVVLAPLSVTARREPRRLRSLDRSGYYDRERAGLGKFLRRDDFEKRNPQQVSDVLRTVNGIRVVPRRGGGQHVTMARGTGLCFPRVFLDGRPVMTAGMTLDDLTLPDDVEAIEVYRGPSEIPPEFAGATAICGAIVIWTRTGDDLAS